MPVESRRTLNKGIMYTAGALLLDEIVGRAFTGEPLHEALGMKSPDYLSKIGELGVAVAWGYSLIKNEKDYMSRRRQEQK